MASKELVKAGDDSQFAVLRMERSEIQELIAENIGDDVLSPADLDRVKVPSGGGSMWEVPTIDGIEGTKEIKGIIIHRATRRAYWPNAYDGSGEQPTCSSNDGVTGHGEPGGPCVECPLNEFESALDGVSKACKEVRQLYVLTADSLIPIVINVPPGSLSNVRSYFVRLMRAQLKATSVVTVIGLEKAKSKAGVEFSKVTLQAGERLEPQAAQLVAAYAADLEPAFRASARVERDEVDA